MLNIAAYLFPSSVEEALEMLAAHSGNARLIAGGTDLVLQSQRGQCPAAVFVDITRIPGLDKIEERDGYIFIGANVTHAAVAKSPLIRQRANVLAEACGMVGGPQIRNVGTLVGNVVNALPAADGAIALTALDAEAEIADEMGRHWAPVIELYEDVGICRVNPCAQMVTALRFHPLERGMNGAYQRLSQRRALCLPMLAVATVVDIEEGRFRQARIAIGPVAPRPLRPAEAEAALDGVPVNAENIAHAARLAAKASHPRDSLLRGSAEYRTAMVEVLVRRALSKAAGLEV